jgi:hypothetical protein
MITIFFSKYFWVLLGGIIHRAKSSYILGSGGVHNLYSQQYLQSKARTVAIQCVPGDITTVGGDHVTSFSVMRVCAMSI